jgi:hypothetical protein
MKEIRKIKNNETSVRELAKMKLDTLQKSVDIENIKNILANKVFNIEDNVTVTELYGTIYSASTNFIATDLQVSRDNITFVDNLLIAGYDEEFKIVQANIEITEI